MGYFKGFLNNLNYINKYRKIKNINFRFKENSFRISGIGEEFLQHYLKSIVENNYCQNPLQGFFLDFVQVPSFGNISINISLLLFLLFTLLFALFNCSIPLQYNLNFFFLIKVRLNLLDEYILATNLKISRSKILYFFTNIYWIIYFFSRKKSKTFE